MDNIFVTKSFLPPIDEYEEYLEQIWANNQLTNQGPLLRNFENEIKKHLGVKDFHFVNNGTIALQLAIKALDIDGGEIITTPFSYVATVSSILWERCQPVFVDINENDFCIDANKIEAAITPKTKAILAVHVFGSPCDVEKIGNIGRQNKIRVIYDGAHSFGVKYKGQSIFNYGDVSTCSFHATKLFHTIEGGAVITSDDKISDAVELMKRFGHEGDTHYRLGINAKASEFQAAMGLCNLRHIEEIIKDRKRASGYYDSFLKGKVRVLQPSPSVDHNFSYYPVVLESEGVLLKTIDQLNAQNIFPRRYFYPSLNKLSYLPQTQNCPISESISEKIMCLPLYFGLKAEIIEKICKIVVANAA